MFGGEDHNRTALEDHSVFPDCDLQTGPFSHHVSKSSDSSSTDTDKEMEIDKLSHASSSSMSVSDFSFSDDSEMDVSQYPTQPSEDRYPLEDTYENPGELKKLPEEESMDVSVFDVRKGAKPRLSCQPSVNEKIDTIWENSKCGGNLLSKVCGYKITEKSIKDLQKELPDEVLDAILHLLKDSRSDKKIFHLPSVIATAIMNGDHGMTDLLRHVTLSDYDIVIGAVNEKQNHWVLLVAYPKEKKIVYINPLGETKERLFEVELNWRVFFDQRCEAGFSELSPEWNLTTVKHSKQNDSISCGIFVIKFVELLLSDQELIFDTSKIPTIRREVAELLLQGSDPLNATCRQCNLTVSTQDELEKRALTDGSNKFNEKLLDHVDDFKPTSVNEDTSFEDVKSGHNPHRDAECEPVSSFEKSSHKTEKGNLLVQGPPVVPTTPFTKKRKKKKYIKKQERQSDSEKSDEGIYEKRKSI